MDVFNLLYAFFEIYFVWYNKWTTWQILFNRNFRWVSACTCAIRISNLCNNCLDDDILSHFLWAGRCKICTGVVTYLIDSDSLDGVEVLRYIWCWSRLYPFKFFKGCLPQNLLRPLLNTLSHISSIIGAVIGGFDVNVLPRSSWCVSVILNGNIWLIQILSLPNCLHLLTTSKSLKVISRSIKK